MSVSDKPGSGVNIQRSGCVPVLSGNTASAGFTLMEIIAAIIAMGAILFIIAGVMSRTAEIYSFISEHQTLSNRSRNAQDIMFMEVKYADSLIVADDQTFEFKTQEDDIIRYEISGGLITRTENDGDTHTVVAGVSDSDSEFSYFTRELNQLTGVPLNSANLALVRFIDVDVVFGGSGEETLLSHRRILLENFRW